MGRKNGNRGRRPQASRQADGTAFKRTANRRVPIEEMIVPVGRCCGKLTFTKTEVAKALEHAQRNHKVTGAVKREERYYECSRGGWHLTSWAEKPS